MRRPSFIKDNVMLDFGFWDSVTFTNFKNSVYVCMCACVRACVCVSASAFLGFVSEEETFLRKQQQNGVEKKKGAFDWESGACVLGRTLSAPA